jgi:hypothetical protein
MVKPAYKMRPWKHRSEVSQISREAQEFLEHLVDMNSTRVQSDVVNRVQESRGQWELEIRKLLREVSRIAERALDRARDPVRRRFWS